MSVVEDGVECCCALAVLPIGLPMRVCDKCHKNEKGKRRKFLQKNFPMGCVQIWPLFITYMIVVSFHIPTLTDLPVSNVRERVIPKK